MKRIIRILTKTSQRIGIGLTITAIVSTSYVQPALAETLPQLIQEGLANFIPGDVCGAPGASTTPGVPADSALPADMIEKINKLKPLYEAAAKEAGVPWQMLPGMHYRENSFAEDRDIQAGNPFGGPHSQASTSYAKYGHPSNLQESLIIAAKVLQDDAVTKGLAHKKIDMAALDVEQIKDTLFSYNGRAQVYKDQAARLGFNPDTQPYEGSPYVMSRFDAVHTDMQLIGKDGKGLSDIDKRYGAFTIYTLIGGPADGATTAVGNSTSCRVGGGGGSGVVSGSFIDVLLSYTQHKYYDAPFLTFTDGYRKAVDEAVQAGVYVGGGNKQFEGVDCGGFVSLLMRNSGTDPNYNAYNGPTSSQEKYMIDNPDKYEKINVGGTGDLRQGDIAVNSVHTYIFVGENDQAVPGFEGNSASASLQERTPMADTAYGFGTFSWYRLKK